MNATRIASISAAFIAVALAASGCANTRDDAPMQTRAPMTPVATAPMAQQPAPIRAEVATPVPAVYAPADPVVTVMPPTMVAAAPSYSMSDNMITERAPRADRN